MKKLTLGGFLKGMVQIISAKPNVPKAVEGNEALQLVLNRRSVRDFKDDPIPDDVFAAILEAGRVAPSTVNMQTWSFVTFTDEEWREFFDSPVPFQAKRAIIILADSHRVKKAITEFPYAPLCEYTVGVMNASLAAMNMNIAAEALGVSSVMLSETGKSGFYDAGYLAEKLELPPGVVPIMSIVFGYPKAGYPPMPPRFPMEAVAFTGAYKETREDVLQEWLTGMQAGYKATYITKAFEKQIAHYKTRIDEAEKDLEGMVFYDGRVNE
jgi:nitroreductase